MVRKSKKLPRHLIVYRTSAMGDVAMLAHALRALKRAYPDLQVTVATRPLFRAFFTDLDVGFLDVDVKGAHHSLCGIWRLAAQARRLGADAVADVHGVLRSVTFRTALRLHGIPFAAIGKGRDEKGEFIRRGGRGVKPAKHTVVRYCDVFRKLGFVFQSFHLINSLNVLDNVELPLLYRKVSAKERRRLAEEVLQKVGLSHRMRHMPTQLSGGQCQRVAIARAIVGNPEIILADEPTGNLDSKMGAEVMELLHQLNKEDGRTIVMVTHNEEQAKQTSRTVRFFDGRQVE